MSATPLVSVLMPAFNAEQHIAQAIRSILEQTYPHFELLILNDGSTDRTQQIIDQFDDERIIKIHSSQNTGLVNARNQLIASAKGDYIAFLDADDIALPGRLQLQVSFLEVHKVDICGGAHYSLYESSGKIKSSKQRYSDPDIRALITVCSPLCNPTVMARAEVFKSHPYSPGKNYAEDYSLWTELALVGYRFANLRESLITYRIHDKQTSQIQNSEINRIFDNSRSAYLAGLGMAKNFPPKSISFFKRLHLAIPFMWNLNQKIPHISVAANYEIYARFQFRGNGLFTPFTRMERLLVSMLASLRGSIRA
jgi:glycosyltransferase involved in cell wall biosynthesis